LLRAIWAAVLLTLLAGRAASSEPVTVAPSPRVTLEARDTPLRGALRLLQAQAGFSYTLESTVPNVPVSLSLRNVPYEDVLHLLVRQAAGSVPGLRVTRREGAYVISVHRDRVGAETVPVDPEPLQPPALTTAFTRKVSVGFHAEGLRQVLARVFALVGVPYTVEPNVPNFPVTVDVRSGTIWEVLSRVLAAAQSQAPVELGQYGDVYVVALRPGPVRADGEPERTAPADRVTLRLQGVPVTLAAEALFRGTPYEYTLMPERPEARVNLDLRDVPLEVALGRLAQEAARSGVRLTWKRRGMDPVQPQHQ
jgi:hypothetical protein